MIWLAINCSHRSLVFKEAFIAAQSRLRGQKLAERFLAVVDEPATGGFAEQFDEAGFSLFFRAPDCRYMVLRLPVAGSAPTSNLTSHEPLPCF